MEDRQSFGFAGSIGFQKTVGNFPFRFRRALSAGRGLSLLSRFRSLRGLRTHAVPAGSDLRLRESFATKQRSDAGAHLCPSPPSASFPAFEGSHRRGGAGFLKKKKSDAPRLAPRRNNAM